MSVVNSSSLGPRAIELGDNELIADAIDIAQSEGAYHQLRIKRRDNRTAAINRFDAFYKVYVTAILATLILYSIAGAIGDEPLTVERLKMWTENKVAWLGLVIASVISIGLRSGSRGGPLGFESADVRHVLLSPLDKNETVRSTAVRFMRHAAFIGASVGAAAALLSIKRLPESPYFWVVSWAIVGILVAMVATGAAMIASGYRLKGLAADALALLLIGWSVIDLYFGFQTSPLTHLAKLTLFPVSIDPISIIGVLVVIAVAVIGIRVANRLSVEAAERRSQLVGQLQFAATMQDMRTIMVLQRQLAQQQLRVPKRSQREPVNSLDNKIALVQVRSENQKEENQTVRMATISIRPFIKRCIQSYRKWTIGRLVRLVAIAAISTFCLVAVWAGNSLFIIGAGIGFWIIGLELVEPLAQEADHPQRTDTSFIGRGMVLVKLLLVPFFLMWLMAQVIFFTSMSLIDGNVGQSLWAITTSGSFAAIIGAAVVVTRKAGAGVVSEPQIASIQMAARVAIPPAIAILGVMPLVPARQSWFTYADSLRIGSDMQLLFSMAMIVSAIGYIWVRYGEDMMKTMASSRKDAEERAVAIRKEKSEREAKERQAKETAKSNSKRRNKKKGGNR